MADAEVGGQHVAALHPAEDPRDRAQVFEASTLAAFCGARTDARVFEFTDRRGSLKVRQDVGVVGDMRAVKTESIRRHLFHRRFPRGVVRSVSLCCCFRIVRRGAR